MPDKFSAVWVSHTSIADFLKCPRAYFLKHIYRDPTTGHKIKLMAPPLALGSAVHEVLESLSYIPSKERFHTSLIERYNEVWKKVSGEKGGFANESSEYKYKERGAEMLRRVMRHPGPLQNLAVKIQKDLPYFWLSEEEGIILCGKIDWLEYFPETQSVHIIDFKTGVSEEDAESLQLPIYHLLVKSCQKYAVTKASYWYLEKSDELTPKELPELETARMRILKVAREVKLARTLKRFVCPKGDGCYVCRPMEAILEGRATLVGVDEFNYDVYIQDIEEEVMPESVIL